LQEVVILLSKLITLIAFILTSKADHVFNAFGISIRRTAKAKNVGFTFSAWDLIFTQLYF
jgi:hypothetical protein